MIGLDKLNSKLVFLEKDSSAKRFYLIDLHNLSSCRLIKKENVAQHICAIYLLCTFKDNSAKDIILPFYDEAKDKLYKMMRLSKKANYWEESINIFRDAPLIHQ